ncbi:MULTISPECIES: 3-methyladenine DNA glycosylase [unclassified Knoellia]|uniref:3-methyladenine DNA glycosylase n=1 Tax=Knoellia altitudinis TaxID=3404795 RepID=UPI00360BD08F
MTAATPPSEVPTLVDLRTWSALETAHQERVDAATVGHRLRRSLGVPHPIEDFLFSYYSTKPAQLRRWHPGVGVRLEGAALLDRASWKHYRVVGDAVEVDVGSFVAARGRAVDFIRRLLSSTASRPARLGCFGLHEWAMVYRAREGDVRHEQVPLRLTQGETDEVVERHQITCSHFDAFRFFTPDALSRNAIQPSRESQVELEQPGCLHAGMDVYKWATKLTPLVPSDLTMDCFDLAMEIRLLDMQASPYDLAAYDVEPVRIETAAGKAAYVGRQRAFAERSNVLRERLLTVLEPLAIPVDQV